MVQKEAKKLKRSEFEKLLKELQNEQSWLIFYTKLANMQPEQAKVCNHRIKALKKSLGFT